MRRGLTSFCRCLCPFCAAEHHRWTSSLPVVTGPRCLASERERSRQGRPGDASDLDWFKLRGQCRDKPGRDGELDKPVVRLYSCSRFARSRHCRRVIERKWSAGEAPPRQHPGRGRLASVPGGASPAPPRASRKRPGASPALHSRKGNGKRERRARRRKQEPGRRSVGCLTGEEMRDGKFGMDVFFRHHRAAAAREPKANGLAAARPGDPDSRRRSALQSGIAGTSLVLGTARRAVPVGRR
jgi:hypothetical protein